MSDDVVIRAEGIGKQYRIGASQQVYGTLRDSVTHVVRRALGREVPPAAAEEFWALKDVSFEVKRGEVLGVIGRNGAGKSTLLKILSRITPPTTGRIEVRGRIGTLLEVGTGFHPELSGRENIFMNGAILGMTRAEIRRKFDEIVDFSGVEKFLDTPVKRYSSGMYVRLAFAVAAHLEPEILLVDEVLAVGDAEFQKKCLGKMSDVAKGGRTIIFVSHNMDAVRRLCSETIWLEKGELLMSSGTESCVSAYVLRGVREGGERVFDPPHLLTNGMPAALHAVRLRDANGNVATHYSAKKSVEVEIEWEALDRLYKPRIGFVLLTADGFAVLTALDATAWANEWLPPGRRISRCQIPGGLLNEGDYLLDIGGDSPNRHDFTLSRTGGILRFTVEDDMTLPNKYYGQEGFRDAKWPGVALVDVPWTQCDAESRV